MDIKLQTDFHDRFIADSNTFTLAHFTCNGAKIIDWIDANFISRQELVEKIQKARHKNCGCCSEQVWDEFVSLVDIRRRDSDSEYCTSGNCAADMDGCYKKHSSNKDN